MVMGKFERAGVPAHIIEPMVNLVGNEPHAEPVATRDDGRQLVSLQHCPGRVGRTRHKQPLERRFFIGSFDIGRRQPPSIGR